MARFMGLVIVPERQRSGRADARILARADEQSTNISFSGNDAFALVRAVDGDTAEGSLIQEEEQTFQVIDSLGDFGADPGYGFDAAE